MQYTKTMPVKVLVLTHGELAAGLLDSAAMICGDIGDAEALGFHPGEGQEDLAASVEERLAGTVEEDGSVLLLADIPGGVPARVAAQFAAEGRCEAVAGVNLPMLLEVLLAADDKTNEELAALAVEKGQEGVLDIGERIRAALADE